MSTLATPTRRSDLEEALSAAPSGQRPVSSRQPIARAAMVFMEWMGELAVGASRAHAMPGQSRDGLLLSREVGALHRASCAPFAGLHPATADRDRRRRPR